MKPVLAFLASFVVATAAATGASVVLHKGHAHPADTTVTDTAAKDSTAADSTAQAAGDSTKANSDSAAHATAAPAGAVPQAAVAPVSAKPGNDTDVVNSANASERRVAKLFSSMQPADAAKALEHMTDNDVQIILGYVGTRQAAAILAAMPADRVATISKLAMHGKGQ